MHSGSKAHTPVVGERHNKSRASTSTKKGAANDMWQENIHFAVEHEDPQDALRISANKKLVNDHDKYVEYIRHVESKSSFQSTLSLSRAFNCHITEFLCFRFETSQVGKPD